VTAPLNGGEPVSVPADAVVLEEGVAVPGAQPGGVWRTLRHDRWAMVSLVVLVLIVLATTAAPLVAPQGPNEQDLLNRLQGPSGQHLLGTDELGRDLLSRLIHGGRVTLYGAGLAVLVALVGGIPLGLLAGYRGGWVDAVLSRLADGLMSVPAIVLALTIVAVLGPGITNAMLAIGLVFVPRFLRLTRATTSDVRRTTFIEASISLGCPTSRILWRHVLPNIASSLLVQVSLLMGAAILAEAAISFLGIGARPPTASWGSLIGGASSRLATHPYLVLAPGLAMVVTVLSLQLLADGVRDALSRGTSRGRA
jgi:peptide/nickel transport system permease protein